MRSASVILCVGVRATSLHQTIVCSIIVELTVVVDAGNHSIDQVGSLSRVILVIINLGFVSRDLSLSVSD